MTLRCSLVLILTLAVPALAGAQPYIEAGAGLTRQSGPTGNVSETYVTAPGGDTLGWQVGGGVFVARWIGLFGEWSTTGRMTAVEASRYFITYHEERRDRFATAGVRLAIPLGSSAALEPNAGVVFTFPGAWSQAFYTDPLVARPPEPRIAHQLETAVGPAFGLDARIGSSRFALVPSARLMRSAVSFGRYDDAPTSPRREIAAIYPGGYPDWTFRASVALRVGL